MDSLEKIIRKKIDRLNSVPNKFIGTIGKVQKQTFSELLSLLDSLDREEGKIILSNSNFDKAGQIANKLGQSIFDTDYKPALKDFISEFSTQAEITDSFFSRSFDSFEPSELYKNVLKSSQKNTLKLLSQEAIGKEFVDPMREILSSSVTNGQNFSEAVKTLRNFIEGDDKLEGTLERYVKQVAKDSFSISDRQYTQTITNDLEIEWYVYRGGLIASSRPFCTMNNDKYFHKKEIEDFGRGIDIDGKKLTPEELQGRKAGTDSSTIFVFAGGYNCDHSWLPVSISIVPKDVIERNIKKGYYETT
jgi:hypothetical protein